jgi:hypothetical protein
MEGIAELFAEYSRPDEFHVQAQLELLAWREGPARREYWRDIKRRGPAKQTHHCSVCGEEGHRGRWRGEVICVGAQARAA